MTTEQHTWTALLVDPSEDVHTQVEARLRPEGIHVLHAMDGGQAGALLAQSIPDIILMELDLPGLRGLDVVKQLRAEPLYARIPVIVLTANADPMLQLQVLGAGATDYIRKPFDANALRARVRAALQNVQPRRPPAAAQATVAGEPSADVPGLDRVGETLGERYVLEVVLGRGGMGEVYRAREKITGRQVAIKLLRDDIKDNPDVLARFRREARAASVVRHPNVVEVLDMGDAADGTPYIVQELLSGEDLAQRLARGGGKLSLDDALAIMLPVADAVAVAHARGVVHRDLKPENIYLDKGGSWGTVVPKVLDFGISKMALSPGEQKVTRTGVAMGTPAYMSPEQIKGTSTLDARSDVWSLGVILYELVSGRQPFRGATQMDLFMAVFTQEPTPLRQLAPHAPEGLEIVVARCLRRVPDERYPTAAELALSLRRVRHNQPV